MEKHDTPVRLEYRGNPKDFTRGVVKLVEDKKLHFDGTDNYAQIIHSLASIMDVINAKTGKTISRETLLSYVKFQRAGEWPEEE